MASPLLTLSPTICATVRLPFLIGLVFRRRISRSHRGLARPGRRRPLLAVTARHRLHDPAPYRPRQRPVSGDEQPPPEQLVEAARRARRPHPVPPRDLLVGCDHQVVLGVAAYPPEKRHLNASSGAS